MSKSTPKTTIDYSSSLISLETMFRVVEKRLWHVTTYKDLSREFHITMGEVGIIVQNSEEIRKKWFHQNTLPARQLLEQSHFPKSQLHKLDDALKQWYTKATTKSRQPISAVSLLSAAIQIVEQLVQSVPSNYSEEVHKSIPGNYINKVQKTIPGNYIKDVPKSIPCNSTENVQVKIEPELEIYEETTDGLIDSVNIDHECYDPPSIIEMSYGYVSSTADTVNINKEIDSNDIQSFESFANYTNDETVVCNSSSIETINNYAEALKSVEPLWDFVWRVNDVRAINLLSGLQDHLTKIGKLEKQYHSNQN